jgi:hypothetical protein
MSYLTQATIAATATMYTRVAQCAASEGETEPDSWASMHARIWAASPDWDAAWESALVSHPEEGYDPGADEGVITDGMILATVQPMIATGP